MSIASNVGAMSSYLNRIRLDPVYTRWREEIEQRIRKIPAIGEKVYALGESIKDALKYIVAEGIIFEELGISYIGPIDGHDIKTIEESVNLAKSSKKPVIVHALTRKGKGYPPAESHPEKFHGTAPFVVKTGKAKVRAGTPSYTDVFGQAVIDLAKKNKKIIAITAAMSSGTGLSKFKEVFPDRFYDVGIAEQHAVTFAAGLVRGGYLPIVAIYSTFLERAYDQIIQDVCLQGLHIIFALDRAGLVGEDGPTHHGTFDLSYLRHIPNIIVMAPKDEEELRHMLYTATKVTQPIAIRYPRGTGLGAKLSAGFKQIKIGQAEVLNEGRKVCLIAIGSMVEIARKVAIFLGQKGISTTVINARFVKPMDKKTIAKASSLHKLVVTFEENVLIGGFGSGILELLSEEGVSTPVVRFGLPDKFISHGDTQKLLEDLGLDAKSIALEIEEKFSTSDYRIEKSDDEVSTQLRKRLWL
jgi:1-deoxy-D-xylulose-5-phosphate synthase